MKWDFNHHGRHECDCNSDHNPVVASLKTRLKKHNIKKNGQKCERCDLDSLKTPAVKDEFIIKLQNKHNALIDEVDEGEQRSGIKEDIDRKYSILVKCISEAISKTLPKWESKKKQAWMSDGILRMMMERRKMKRKFGNREKDKAIRKACTEAKEKWMNAQCREIEDLEDTKQWKHMHQNIKEVIGRSRKAHSAGILGWEHFVWNGQDSEEMGWVYTPPQQTPTEIQ